MGVPTHRIEIRKLYEGHSYSNDYNVECPSMDDAEAMAVALVEFEQTFHLNNVVFVYYRISSAAIGDRIFRHEPINAIGQRARSGTSQLPLFNTVRLDMRTEDSDPCRKYYRPPLEETDQEDGHLSPGYWTAIVSAWYAMNGTFPTGSKIVSGKGHNVVGVAGFPDVQMRQLHRHRKKKLP
jgi:hypothetical protein